MAVARRNSDRLLKSVIHLSRLFSYGPFGPPPRLPSRRVVVTGLGMVTPLGCGVEFTWKWLLDGDCGIRAITIEDLKMSGFDGETQQHTYDQLTSKVAGIVPCGSKPVLHEKIAYGEKEATSQICYDHLAFMEEVLLSALIAATEQQAATFVMNIWLLWKARNEAVWNNSFEPAAHILSSTRTVVVQD